jgi:hypothetical protein
VSFESLIDELTSRLLSWSSRCRVAVDGAVALSPTRYGGALVDRLHADGRFAQHVSIQDYLRPASQRFEFGRTNPESFYQNWRDERALQREVLDPAAAGGTGRILPALWRTDIDRSARASYVELPGDGVVVVSGQFLLGGGLPFDVTVHLECSPAALARRTPPPEQWTLPAYARYADEVRPAGFADVVIRLEDPRRPAIVDLAG